MLRYLQKSGIRPDIRSIHKSDPAEVWIWIIKIWILNSACYSDYEAGLQVKANLVTEQASVHVVVVHHVTIVAMDMGC